MDLQITLGQDKSLIRTVKYAIIVEKPILSGISEPHQGLETQWSSLPVNTLAYYFSSYGHGKHNFNAEKSRLVQDIQSVKEYQAKSVGTLTKQQPELSLREDQERQRYYWRLPSLQTTISLCKILAAEQGDEPQLKTMRTANSSLGYCLIEQITRHYDGEWDGYWNSGTSLERFAQFTDLQQRFRERKLPAWESWIEFEARFAAKVVSIYSTVNGGK